MCTRIKRGKSSSSASESNTVLGPFDVELEEIDAVVAELSHHRAGATADGCEVRVGVLDVRDGVRHVRLILRCPEGLLRILGPQSDGVKVET